MRCQKCGMGYIPSLPENEVEHSQYCDLIANGPAVGVLKQESVIWASIDDRILLVTDKSSEEQKKLADDVSMCANREMDYTGGIYHHYDLPDEKQVKIFLYVRASRAVGMCLVERRNTVWRCTWSAGRTPACVECPTITAMWSVGFIWVHNQHRKTGIAYLMFKEAKRVLNLGQDDIGWYTPLSAEGEAFVQRQCPAHFFVAK